jgi:hypothetical protein
MKKTIFASIIIAAAVVASCGPSYAETHKIRAADLEAWRGAQLVELETHEMFSTFPRKVQPLSDGGELWTYSECERWRTDTRCTTVGGSTWATTNCNGGQIGERCCRHQFYVRDKTVGWYRPNGPCFTKCYSRPASKACKDESE